MVFRNVRRTGHPWRTGATAILASLSPISFSVPKELDD